MFQKNIILTLRTLALALPLYSLPPLPSHAEESNKLQISVDGVQRYFRAGENPVKNVRVTNQSNITYVVNSVLQHQRNPGERVADLMDDNETFLFAPKKFSLRGGESRLVRVVLSKPLTDKEALFRLNFVPKHKEFYVPGSEKKDAIHFGTRFIVSTGMLVLVSPKNPEPNLTYERDEDGITFKNEGNVAIDLRRDLNHCFDRKKENCVELPGKRIYPGKTWHFPLSGEKPLTYHYQVYEENVSSSPIKIDAMY